MGSITGNGVDSWHKESNHPFTTGLVVNEESMKLDLRAHNFCQWFDGAVWITRRLSRPQTTCATFPGMFSSTMGRGRKPRVKQLTHIHLEKLK